MKHVCTNCHFLAKDYREQNTGRVLSFSISKKERDMAIQGNVDFLNEEYCLKCHKGVWDEGISNDSKNRIHSVTAIKRKDKCFFYLYDPCMMFSAAEKLQKREQENRQIKISNIYTRVGLWVAAFALFVNAIIGIIRLGNCS